jgi:sensory rhodopsin
MLGFAVGYAVSLLVLVAWLRRIPEAYHSYCYPLVGLVALAAVVQTATAFGVGTISVGAGELDVPSVIEGGIVYGGLFAFAAVIAGLTRRQLVVAGGLPLVMNYSFQLASVGEGVVAAVGALITVLGFPVLCWLFFRPYARAAEAQSPGRQRLFRKFRNLLLFLIGVLIVTALTSLDVFVPGVSNLLVAYVDFLLRVGFAGFLFANADVFSEF